MAAQVGGGPFDAKKDPPTPSPPTMLEFVNTSLGEDSKRIGTPISKSAQSIPLDPDETKTKLHSTTVAKNDSTKTCQKRRSPGGTLFTSQYTDSKHAPIDMANVTTLFKMSQGLESPRPQDNTIHHPNATDIPIASKSTKTTLVTSPNPALPIPITSSKSMDACKTEEKRLPISEHSKNDGIKPSSIEPKTPPSKPLSTIQDKAQKNLRAKVKILGGELVKYVDCETLTDIKLPDGSIIHERPKNIKRRKQPFKKKSQIVPADVVNAVVTKPVTLFAKPNDKLRTNSIRTPLASPFSLATGIGTSPPSVLQDTPEDQCDRPLKRPRYLYTPERTTPDYLAYVHHQLSLNVWELDYEIQTVKLYVGCVWKSKKDAGYYVIHGNEKKYFGPRTYGTLELAEAAAWKRMREISDEKGLTKKFDLLKPTREIEEYFAAFIDGDGCIGSGFRKDTIPMKVVVTQVSSNENNPPVLDHFQSFYGGKVKLRKPASETTRPVYQHAVYGQLSRRLMRIVSEYGTLKANQARMILKVISKQLDDIKQLRKTSVEKNRKLYDALKRAKKRYSKVVVKSERLQIPYLAGLFDAEGSITLNARKKGGYHLRIAFSQKSAPQLLRAIRNKIGGIGSVGSGKLALSSNASETLLLKMFPYLVVKREQAEVAIRYQVNRRAMRAKNVSSEVIFAEDKRVFNQLQFLKRYEDEDTKAKRLFILAHESNNGSAEFENDTDDDGDGDENDDSESSGSDEEDEGDESSESDEEDDDGEQEPKKPGIAKSTAQPVPKPMRTGTPVAAKKARHKKADSDHGANDENDDD